MATMDPLEPQDGNEHSLYTGETHRRKVIKTLPFIKQLTIEQYLRNTDKLSREQAIELLKDALVQIAQKDAIFVDLMKNNM